LGGEVYSAMKKSDSEGGTAKTRKRFEKKGTPSDE